MAAAASTGVGGAAGASATWTSPVLVENTGLATGAGACAGAGLTGFMGAGIGWLAVGSDEGDAGTAAGALGGAAISITGFVGV